MIKNKDKRDEFTRLLLTCKYTQSDLAKIIGVSRQTVSKWIKETHPVVYFSVRKRLAGELERITKQWDYEANRDIISQLITDIERIEKLIIKAKYIPNLTQK